MKGILRETSRLVQEVTDLFIIKNLCAGIKTSHCLKGTSHANCPKLVNVPQTLPTLRVCTKPGNSESQRRNTVINLAEIKCKLLKKIGL